MSELGVVYKEILNKVRTARHAAKTGDHKLATFLAIELVGSASHYNHLVCLLEATVESIEKNESEKT